MDLCWLKLHFWWNDFTDHSKAFFFCESLFFGFVFVMAVFVWHQNGVRRCLACPSGLPRSHNRGWVASRCNWAKTAQLYLLKAKQVSPLPCLGWNSARSAYASSAHIRWAVTWSKSIECLAGYRLQAAYWRQSKRNAPYPFVGVCWERAKLMSLVCGVWVCHCPNCILGQVWYLIVSISDLCTLIYLKLCSVWRSVTVGQSWI